MTEIIEQTSNLTVKILIIGDSVVGKTCLLLRFSKNNFKSETVYTIGVHFMDRTMEVSGQLVKIQGWDTAGQVMNFFFSFLSRNRFYRTKSLFFDLDLLFTRPFVFTDQKKNKGIKGTKETKQPIKKMLGFRLKKNY
eukprot:Anaeramoba_flamelloidesc39002_g1_i4.p1 GENE.c39002_g1_i4~~c39002_g1_i4.p1  ORF type:complete len:137 (-),score=9.31 c39002_g1_i4:36-446(-)